MRSTNRIYNPQTGQRSTHFGWIERVSLVLVKVTERGLELLQLGGRQVGHVSRHDLNTFVSGPTEVKGFYLVIDEGNLLGDALNDLLKFELEILRGKDSVVILLNVRSITIVFGFNNIRQCI